VKYYGAEEFEVNRYKSAVLAYQVCCTIVTVIGHNLFFVDCMMLLTVFSQILLSTFSHGCCLLSHTVNVGHTRRPPLFSREHHLS